MNILELRHEDLLHRLLTCHYHAKMLKNSEWHHFHIMMSLQCQQILSMTAAIGRST